MNDQYTLDYLRNIFGKYLVYMAKKKLKKAKTCEDILFTLLNISEEQITLINKARKRHSFWDLFKNFGKTGQFGMDTLDMNLNFTMTDMGDSSMIQPNLYGGNLMGEDQFNKNIETQKKKKIKKKATKKTTDGKGNDNFSLDPQISEQEIKLKNDEAQSAVLK